MSGSNLSVPEGGTLLRRRRGTREELSGLRLRLGLHAIVGLGFVFLAVAHWSDADGETWLRAAYSVVAVAWLGQGVFLWRGSQRARGRLEALAGVDLVPVGEAELARLVAAALGGAAADEVTPRVTPGEAWTPERVEWLRAFHRAARQGLDGPAREVTWTVVGVGGEQSDVARVLGSVRLRRTGDAGVLEAGIWLVRDARGRGVGRAAVRLVLDRAREAGATAVRADTTRENAGALGVLRSLGFGVTTDGDRVRAVLPLTG